MRTRSAGTRIFGLLGAVILLGAGCFPIPSIKEKVVELVATSSVAADFVAQGSVNALQDTITVALDDSLDLAGLLGDAGIDSNEVVSISFAGASYEVLVPDTVPSRTIENGTITVQREGAAAATDLITDLSVPVAVTGYEETVVMEAAGVAVIDGVLQDLLLAFKAGTTVPDAEMTFTVSGESHPIDQASDFRWRLKLYVCVVGQLKMDLIDF
jgi:hypothetical protein